VPGLRRDDWPLRDPKGKATAEVRAIREEIKSRVKALLTSEACGDASHPTLEKPGREK
jgi:arsenate reductase (thioredoxin)